MAYVVCFSISPPSLVQSLNDITYNFKDSLIMPFCFINSSSSLNIFLSNSLNWLINSTSFPSLPSPSITNNKPCVLILSLLSINIALNPLSISVVIFLFVELPGNTSLGVPEHEYWKFNGFSLSILPPNPFKWIIKPSSLNLSSNVLASLLFSSIRLVSPPGAAPAMTPGRAASAPPLLTLL